MRVLSDQEVFVEEILRRLTGQSIHQKKKKSQRKPKHSNNQKTWMEIKFVPRHSSHDTLLCTVH